MIYSRSIRKKQPSSSVEQSVCKQSRVTQYFEVPLQASQKNLDEAIVEFLAESNVAFRVVDLDSFKKMFSFLNNKVKIRSQRFYSKMVTTKSDEMRKDLYSIIEFLRDELVTVSFTSDLWTSVNSDSYISLTMHFISRGWNLYRFCPYAKPFPERHT